MRKLYFFAALGVLGHASLAQPGLHPQERTSNNVWIKNKDSVYMTLGIYTNFSRMCIINPNTKSWSYLNTNAQDYHHYMGTFVMRTNTEGVMIYPSGGKTYRTTDNWQTTVDVSTPTTALTDLLLTPAGYVGYNNGPRQAFFSTTGATWTQVISNAGGTSSNLIRSKGNKVIIYTGNSTSQVSTDGGQTYSLVNLNMNFSGTAHSFVMASVDTFYFATTNNLYKTVDGGATPWTTLTTPAAPGYITVKNSNELYFTTAGGQAYYSSNGGNTWQARAGTAYNNAVYIGNTLYSFPDVSSTDNGNTWQTFMPINVSVNSIFDVHFNGNKGMLGLTNGGVQFSFDKGRSFDNKVTPATTQDIMAVKVLKNGDCIVGDRNGQVFYSTNNGQTWSKNYTSTNSYNAFKFSGSSSDSIMVLTRSGASPLVSTDHGASWNLLNVLPGGSHSQSVKPNGQINDVVGWFSYVTFSNKGWEISKYTPTGTKTVLDTFLANNETLIDIHNASNNVGYLFTYENTTKQTRVYRSTSGWSSGSTSLRGTINPVVSTVTNYENSTTANRLTRIQTFGTDTIILGCGGNRFYHYSYDGGLSWNRDSIGDVHSVYNSLYPSIRRAYFWKPGEMAVALNNAGLYINTGGTAPLAGIKELSIDPAANGELKIYPNPASSIINFEGDTNEALTLRIYDHTGKLVIEKINSGNRINVEELPAGFYIMTAITNKGQQHSGRFVKMN